MPEATPSDLIESQELLMLAPLFTLLSFLRRPAAARVRVFHTNNFRDACVLGYRAEHTVTEVFAYTIGAAEAGLGDPALLEQTYFLLNVGDDPDFGPPDERAVAYRTRRNRALSAGDVVAIDGRFYACKSSGWSLLDQAPRIEQRTSHGTTPLVRPAVGRMRRLRAAAAAAARTCRSCITRRWKAINTR